MFHIKSFRVQDFLILLFMLKIFFCTALTVLTASTNTSTSTTLGNPGKEKPLKRPETEDDMEELDVDAEWACGTE